MKRWEQTHIDVTCDRGSVRVGPRSAYLVSLVGALFSLVI